MSRGYPILLLSLAAGLTGCGPAGGVVEESSAESSGMGAPRILLAGDGSAFVLTGLESGDVTALEAATLDRREWAEVLSVHVATEGEDLPAVVGSYSIESGNVRFEPRFPLRPGLTYRAIHRSARLEALRASHAGGDRDREPAALVEAEFRLPDTSGPPSTLVARVYPTADVLPENQLKFYIHFSAPMGRGEAYEHVRLLDASGTEVDIPFLELGEELWDPDGRRFTLFFDPGRVKRELRPHEEMGPPLVKGESFTLLIDRNWRDATGRPLKDSHRKEFRVGPPDYLSPDPGSWTVRAPRAGGREAVVVDFPEPLDNALLRRLLWIRDTGGQNLEGRIEVSAGERRWKFTPDSAWQPGPHELVIQTTLEDLAGNSIGRPFEVDMFREVRRRVEIDTVSLPLEITGN